MKENKLFKNSSYSVLQTMVLALSALILFKLMVLHTGLKVTGVWSYLSSITSITGFGCYGFANALVYFIPKYQLRHGDKNIKSLINTAFFSVLAFTTLLCLISYVIFTLIIPVTVDKVNVELARKLLLYIVPAFFFSGLSIAYLSVLDGLVLMHVRAKINMAGAIVFFISGYFLLLKFGIIGITIAQLIQNIFLLICSYLIVKKQLPSYSFSFQFNKIIFKDIFRYGFNFQVMSITQIISDPFMKTMITKYAGSNNTAIFDFCIKLMSVSRSLLISANQTIVPQITIFNTIGHVNRLKTFYRANFQLVLFIGIILFLSPIAMTDAISIFFLNKIDRGFNFILFTISIGLLINAIAFPAHFHYLGIGNLKWNVINNVVTACIILIFTPLIGELIGGSYVILCWSASAIIGSSILIWAFQKEFRVTVPFFTSNIAILLLAILCATIINHFLNKIPVIKSSYLILILSNIFTLLIFILYPILTNSGVIKLRKKLLINRKKI